MAVDPVCGMHVAETPGALQVRRGNATYYFCSLDCKRQFEAPEHEIRLLQTYTVFSFLAGGFLLILMFVRSPWDESTTNLVALGLATPVQFVAGSRFYRGLWHALHNRLANMDTLIAIGTTTAYGYSVFATFVPERFGAATYYDTSVLIIAFVLLGRLLEHRMKERATRSVRALVALRPTTARLVTGGHEREVPIDEVRPGMMFRVWPGERIPTDGRIVDGEAAVDEALLTGESVPVTRKPGDEVVGGSINTDGTLLVEATRVGADSFVAQVTQLVEQAQAGQAPIQRLVDRISAWFVPIVLAIALGSALVWILVLDSSVAQGAFVAVAIVIVACPCALGLATPAALLVGSARGAENGILIKETAQLERLAKIDTAFFDKTGTLTAGRLHVEAVRAFAPAAEADVLRAAASVEATSEHPIARAIVAEAERRGLTPKTAQGFRSEAGVGVQATIDGDRSLVGKLDWLARQGVAVAEGPGAEPGAGPAGTTVGVATGSRLLGEIRLSDTIKPGSKEAIARLRRWRVRTVLLSGDNEAVAKDVASALGMDDVRAPVPPAQKAAVIEAEKRAGHRVAMVGDGVNDAPALATADVGIALGSGTDVAREAGGILLLRDDPRDVVNAFVLARATRAKIWQNLFWAFAYNVALIPVAAVGILDPVYAGAAMGLSSVTVVGNSLRLRSYKPPLSTEGDRKRRAAPAAPSPPRLRVVEPMREDPGGAAKDPVCGMRVDPARTPFQVERDGTHYYFCSQGCRDRFLAAPTQYAGDGN